MILVNLDLALESSGDGLSRVGCRAQTNLSAENVGVLVAKDPLDSQLEIVVNEIRALRNY